jgi:gluconate:H+ symporter, GntP family
VLLPVVLMLVKALVEIVVDDPESGIQRVTDVIGSPLIAMLAAVIVGIFTLGRAAGFTKDRISSTVEKSLAPIAGILAGFWLVKEYFGMTVGQTIKTWSVMETIISVVGIGFVLLLSLVL